MGLSFPYPVPASGLINLCNFSGPDFAALEVRLYETVKIGDEVTAFHRIFDFDAPALTEAGTANVHSISLTEGEMEEWAGFANDINKVVKQKYSVDGAYVGGSVFSYTASCARPFNNTNIWMLTAHIGSDGLISDYGVALYYKDRNFWACGERLSVDRYLPAQNGEVNSFGILQTDLEAALLSLWHREGYSASILMEEMRKAGFAVVGSTDLLGGAPEGADRAAIFKIESPWATPDKRGNLAYFRAGGFLVPSSKSHVYIHYHSATDEIIRISQYEAPGVPAEFIE